MLNITMINEAVEKTLIEIKNYENNCVSYKELEKLYNEAFLKSEWFLEQTENVKRAILENSFLKFYKNKITHTPLRIIGFREIDNQIAAEAIDLTGWTSTMTLYNLEHIEKWAPEDIELIEKHAENNPIINFIFRHPLGFTFLNEL